MKELKVSIPQNYQEGYMLLHINEFEKLSLFSDSLTFLYVFV